MLLQLGQHSIGSFLKQCAQSAGIVIPGLHPHSLQLVAIMNLIRAEVATHQIQEASGHCSAMSIAKYIHSLENQRLAVANLAMQSGDGDGCHEVQQRIILSQKNVNVLNVKRQPQKLHKYQPSFQPSSAVEGLFKGANLTGSTVNINFNFLSNVAHVNHGCHDMVNMAAVSDIEAEAEAAEAFADAAADAYAAVNLQVQEDSGKNLGYSSETQILAV